MSEYICFFILVIFALFGICEFAHLIKLLILFPKRRMNSQLIIKLDKNNAEKQLMFAISQYLWLGDKYADSILADASELDDDTYCRCKIIAEKYNILI